MLLISFRYLNLAHLEEHFRIRSHRFFEGLFKVSPRQRSSLAAILPLREKTLSKSIESDVIEVFVRLLGGLWFTRDALSVN